MKQITLLEDASADDVIRPDLFTLQILEEDEAVYVDGHPYWAKPFLVHTHPDYDRHSDGWLYYFEGMGFLSMVHAVKVFEALYAVTPDKDQLNPIKLVEVDK